MRFIDLFAGLGGFHIAMQSLGHRCVFASEIDPELRTLYGQNFGTTPHGDIREIPATTIPEHDVLCAGFPCQPFSKAGEQKGTKCKLWGNLFDAHVLRIVRRHRPSYLIMENVANLERHDGGRTWVKMRRQLEELGYDVDARVLSPHHYGVPQIRERLFIVASRAGLANFQWPKESDAEPTILDVLENDARNAKPISTHVLNCLNAWQEFLDRAPMRVKLPSWPIWTMEFGATYPFTKYESLTDMPLSRLRQYRGSFGQTLNCNRWADLLARLPSYARPSANAFPLWKQHFIRCNRQFYLDNKRWIRPWLPRIQEFAPSLQKFEWNCKDERRNIWDFVIQFRASGVRVKRQTTAPSLVAMTITQVPIIGWEKRYMTPRERSRLQSMQSLKFLPKSETGVCRALGNAVNVAVVKTIAQALCGLSTPIKQAV